MRRFNLEHEQGAHGGTLEPWIAHALRDWALPHSVRSQITAEVATDLAKALSTCRPLDEKNAKSRLVTD